MQQFARWDVQALQPRSSADLACEPLAQWLDELSHDLKLVPARPLVCRWIDPPGGPPGEWIELESGDNERLTLRLPRRLDRDPAPNDEAAARDLAERAHRAVFAARWWLLRLFAGVDSDRLRLAAELGLDGEDVKALGDDPVSDSDALDAMAARRAEACCRLLLPRERLDGPEATETFRETLDEALRDVGVPCPTAVGEAALDADRFRLCVRRLRTPVYPLVDKDFPAHIGRALRHHAGMLIDGGAVGRLLLSPGALPLPDARALLRQASPAQWAGALRRLFDDRLSLATAGQLAWAATVLPIGVYARSGLTVAMPGSVGQSSQPAPSDNGTERLAWRLRASLVRHTLQRRSADIGDSALSVWELRPSSSGKSGTDARHVLIDAALPCARADGVLLTPPGEAPAVRGLLADALPTLLVVDTREWPEDVPLRRRAIITVSISSNQIGTRHE